MPRKSTTTDAVADATTDATTTVADDLAAAVAAAADALATAADYDDLAAAVADVAAAADYDAVAAAVASVRPTMADVVGRMSTRLAAMAATDDLAGTAVADDLAAAAVAVRWVACPQRSDAVAAVPAAMAAAALDAAADAVADAVASLAADAMAAAADADAAAVAMAAIAILAADAADAADDLAADAVATVSASSVDTIYLRAAAADGRLAPFYSAIVRSEKVERDGITGAVKSVADTVAWQVGTTPAAAALKAADADAAGTAGGALVVPVGIADGIGAWRPCYSDGSLIADVGAVPIFTLAARRGEGRPVGTIGGHHGAHDLAITALPTAGQRKDGRRTISLRMAWRTPVVAAAAAAADYDELADAVAFFG